LSLALWALTVFILSLKCGPKKKDNPMQAEVSTEKKRAGKDFSNRLTAEKSPYLQQHQHNPVDWYPWGPEAFERAREEDKPIFLSIGYSTCHWCHVMAHESFEDADVARLLNRAFVSIKVDREERPDVDHVYMNVCQLMTRGGGWPLTIIMTPDKKPFFAGTYFPKNSRFGRVGMMELLPSIEKSWQEKRAELEDLSRRVVEGLRRLEEGGDPSPLGKEAAPVGEEALNRGFVELASAFDGEHGGFGRGMKFPMPHQLLFLLRYSSRTGNDNALQMVRTSLSKMAAGGIFDHLGYGFHRYSTDPEWLVPHFEKMLYDQALLLLAYTEGFEATGEQEFAIPARGIAEYVLRDLTGPEKGFYSAEDADSEGEEGKFYLWSQQQIRQHLDPEAAELFLSVFNVREQGNYRDEASGETTGRNILHRTRTLDELARERGIDRGELDSMLARGRDALFRVREDRARPLLDDKILTDWNGLMIGALAKAGRVFREPRYREAALEAARFVLSSLTDKKGKLLHRYREGESAIAGQLDDYAFMIFGLIELYQATFDPRHLQEAMRLNALVFEEFHDKEKGGFYLTGTGQEEILVRSRDLYDGAIPSGSSVQFYNLLRLSRLTGDLSLETAAERLGRIYGGSIGTGASSHAMFLLGLDFALGPSVEVVISGRRDAPDTKALLDVVESSYLPRAVLLLRDSDGYGELARVAPFVELQTPRGGRATAYVCKGGACSSPTNSAEKMIESIKQATKK